MKVSSLYSCIASSKKAKEAYSKLNDVTDPEEWIMILDSSYRYPPIQMIKWDHVVFDLSQQYPDFFNIREPDDGVQQKDMKYKYYKYGDNTHGIIEFTAE